MEYWWKDIPWRYIQTNLRQIDMLDMDAETYVKELKKFDAKITMINTSGILASYPTKLKYHPQSPYLKADSVKKMIDVCHREGIRVIARTDFSKIRREVYEQHPEWAYRTPEGGIVDYNGDVHACINGGFQREYMLEILRETLTELPVDGIYFNMAGYQTRDYSGVYHGICHCDNCRRMFRERCGMELPPRENMADPAYRRYLEFKKETEAEHGRRVCEMIRSIRPDILIHRDTFTTDSAYMREEDSTALDRGLPHWQYIGSEQSKLVRASYPGYRQSNCDVDFIDFPIRLVSVSPAQHALRLAQGFANGGGPDYYLIGRLDNAEDKSAQARVRELFDFHRRNEKLLDGVVPCSRVAIIRPESHDGHTTAEYRGWYRALTEGHFPFDAIYASRMEAVGLARYTTLILPDDRYMSDSRAALIDSFAANGGTVIATGETGFYDEHYERREMPALSCLGIGRCLNVRDDARGAYFKISQGDPLPGFAPDEQLVALDGTYLYNDYQADVERHLSFIPPSHFGPPERCYYTQVTDLPGYTSHGTAVYVPWYAGEFYYRQGYSNSFKFMDGILERYASARRVRGDFSPMIEIAVMITPDIKTELLSFVNASGHFGNSFLEPIPCEVTCSMAVPKAPARVYSMTTGKALDYTFEDGRVTLTLPKLGLFDAAVIDY